MCTGLWDSCLGLFAVHLWGDKDTRKVPSAKENDAWRRAKGRQQNRVDFAPPGSSEPGSREASEGDDSKNAGLLEKAKPRGVSHKNLDSALELLHVKKKAPKPVPYVATVVAQQEIVTEMQAAEYLQHPHAIYLQEMLIAEACAVPLDVVCVTGVVDKLFPESIFLEDGGIIVQYALVINYRITIDIAALPTEDPKAVAVAFINEKLNGAQTGHRYRYDYLFTMQACITQLSRLKDAQIQLVKVINTAALTNADDPEVTSTLTLATSKSYKYYGNQGVLKDVSERCTLIQRRKEEEEARALVTAYVAEQVRLKKADARAEQRKKRRKERVRELEIKEHSDDEEEKEDEDEDGSDNDSYIEHKLGSSRVPSPRSGAPTPPVALAGLGMEIMRLQNLINPTVMHSQEDKKF